MCFTKNWAARTVLAFLLGSVGATCCAEDSRFVFFQKIRTIDKGMSISQVEKILGKPDDIWTQKDSAMKSFVQVHTIWCYGTKTHLGFAALGRVHFDRLGQVCEINGNTGKPIKTEHLSESKLRELMLMLDNCPTVSGGKYNPFEIISIANAFQPLGQKTSFAVIREYFRLESSIIEGNDQGVILLLHCLHKVPEPPGYFPYASLGRASPPGPSDEATLRNSPHLPLHFVDDIPLLVVMGYSYIGSLRPAECQLELFEDKIDWIPSLLPVNKKSKQQLSQALVKYRESRSWYFDKDSENRIYTSEIMFKAFGIQLDKFVKSRTKYGATIRTTRNEAETGTVPKN